MLIERIRVENFRSLKGPIEVRLGPGLNVIHGPNETGKSTLVDAILTLLTVKANSTGAIQRDIRPRDGSIATISLVLTHAGARYTIAKKFSGQSGTVRLQIRTTDGGAEDLSSDAAEARLRTLLGIEYKTANARGQPVTLGLLPLLFVRQGDGIVEPSSALGSSGQASLTSRLSAEAGTVITGSRSGLFEPGSDRLIERAKRERDRYFQDASDQWRRTSSPIGDASALLESAREEVALLAGRATSFEASLDRHSVVREAIRAIAGRLPGLATEAKTAAEAAANGRRRLDRLEHQRIALAARETELLSVSEWRTQRTRISECAEKAKTAHDDAVRASDTLRDRMQSHDQRRRVAAAALDEHRNATREATRRVERASHHLRALEAGAVLSDLSQRRVLVSALTCRIADLEGKSAAGPDRKQIERLERLQHATERSDLAVESVSAGARITARKPCSIVIDEQRRELAAGEAVQRKTRSSFHFGIADLVDVVIEPGAIAVAELERKASRDRAALEEALRGIGCTSVSEAQRALEVRHAAEVEIAASKRELELLAPRGMHGLESQFSASVAKAAVATRRVVEASLIDDFPLPAAVEEAIALVDVLERAQGPMNVRLVELEHELHEQSLIRERVLTELVARDAERCSATRRLADCDEAMKLSLASHGDDAALAAAVAEAQAARDEARRVIDETTRSLSDIDLSAAELQAERAENARATAHSELERLRREEAKLCGELQAADLVGLHERLESATGREHEAAANLARIKIDAEAARLLYETLRDARDEARRKYFAPLRAELESSLALLLPGATISLDDQFAISRLERSPEGLDAFAQLSFGTREQIAILTRLAFARILAGGQPLPVILDDVLAASDPERAGRMSTVLFRAAKSLQVIILTCDLDRYRRLGCPPGQVVDLQSELRQSSAQPRPSRGEQSPKSANQNLRVE